jgi:putative endonuclease
MLMKICNKRTNSLTKNHKSQNQWDINRVLTLSLSVRLGRRKLVFEGSNMHGLPTLMHRYRLVYRSLKKYTRQVWQPIENRWLDFRKSMRYFPPCHDETTGQYGERLAIEYLRRCGYFILEHSYKSPLGEIDIIAAWKASKVVFVEVKTWSCRNDNQGGPADAVDDVKQRKICRTALHYSKRHGLLDTPGRFDVIEVILGTDPGRPEFRHIQAAFESQEMFQLHS